MTGRYVYVIGVTANPVKIGLSDNVTARLSSLQTGCPELLRIHYRHLAPYNQAASIEASCHASFADRRRRGEWFNVDAAEAIALIKRSAEAIKNLTDDRQPDLIHDVERLIAREEVGYHVLAAIADYRAHMDRAGSKAEIARRDRLILLKAGPEALAVFEMVALQRKPLAATLRRDTSVFRKAEEALRRALIVIANDHEYRRRTGKLDQFLEKVA